MPTEKRFSTRTEARNLIGIVLDAFEDDDRTTPGEQLIALAYAAQAAATLKAGEMIAEALRELKSHDSP